MNKTINKFLLTSNKFMLKLHLKQSGFTYKVCGAFTIHCEKIQKSGETVNVKHLYRNGLDKACFAHDAAYSDNKDFAKTAISNKILKERAHETARNRNYDGYQRGLASIAYKFFDTKTGSGAIQQQAKQERVNEQLAKELHKPVTKKIKRRKVYERFKDNIWATDLAVTESLSSKNKNIKYLLCAIDVFTKYAWVKLLKDKKGKTVLNAFFETVDESNHKPNKLWVDQV